MKWKTHLLLPPAALAGLWWLLADGKFESWIIGIPAVVGATWATYRLQSPKHAPISIKGLLSFAPYFLIESVRGGVDVASRTLRPRMRINPGLHTYRLRLQRRDARVFFVGCISLLPGTLSAKLDEGQVRVHVLDAKSAVDDELMRLEQAIGRIYREAL
jgi:multicomponent Na+:H+ antiporter subunit E